jgi:group I intron endonuclease
MPRKINRVIYRFWHDKSAAGRIGYIGKDCFHPSRFNLKWRIKEKAFPKLYRALKKYPLEIWHREILASGFRSDASLIKAEIWYIREFDSKNKGYNLTDGGEGVPGRKMSDKTKRKISKSHKGLGHSVATRKKLSKINKEKVMSPEARRKISDALKGRKVSLETRKKISKAHLGMKASVEAKKKMSQAKKGSRWSKARREAYNASH